MARRMSRMARMEIMRPDRSREAESRFRDRRGREHYDNGRFAPMRNDTNIEIEGRFRDDYSAERFEREPYTPMNRDYGDARYMPYGPFPVYREHDGMRGGGDDMNQIGFDMNREMDGGRYRMNAGHHTGDEMAYRHGSRMHGGAWSSEEEAEPMTKEAAERWVHSMKGAGGTAGQHWSMEQAKQIMSRYGYQDDPVEFYVALNMMKSDYTKAAQKMGVDKEEFYACMANAFLNDEDAHHDKLARYWRSIVKH